MMARSAKCSYSSAICRIIARESGPVLARQACASQRRADANAQDRRSKTTRHTHTPQVRLPIIVVQKGPPSGYHMVVVTGVVFFTLRALFALMPAFANRYAIKKWVTAVPSTPG